MADRKRGSSIKLCKANRFHSRKPDLDLPMACRSAAAHREPHRSNIRLSLSNHPSRDFFFLNDGFSTCFRSRMALGVTSTSSSSSM